MINRLFQIITVGLISLAFLTGCAKQSKVDLSVLTPSNFSKPLMNKLIGAGKVSTIRALIDTEIHYKGVKKRFDLSVVAKKPDWVRMEFVDPLAGPVLSIVATPEKVIYANASGVYFYDGEDGDTAFKEMTRLPWSPREAIRIFMGGLPVSVASNARYPQDSEGKYWVDEGEGTLSWNEEEERLIYTELNGKKVRAKVEYSDYLMDGEYGFPARIRVDLNSPKTSVKLYYKDVDLNPHLNPGVFSQMNFVSYEKYEIHKSE